MGIQIRMPSLSDLLCGCNLQSLKRGTPSVIDGNHAPPAPTSTGQQGSSGTPACYYEADPNDPIDMQLSWQLMSLDRAFASSLMIRRLSPGEYEFDGRPLRLRRAAGAPELLALEGGEAGDLYSSELTLSAYLRQVAGVAASLGGRCAGSPKVARVPADRRLTFAGIPSQVSDDPGLERVRSMRVACEQARLREHAAEAYERAERELQPGPGYRRSMSHPSSGGSVVSKPGMGSFSRRGTDNFSRMDTPSQGQLSRSMTPLQGSHLRSASSGAQPQQTWAALGASPTLLWGPPPSAASAATLF